MNPNANRIYTKATHCKRCEKSFEEVEKYLNHAMCCECYRKHQQVYHKNMPIAMVKEFKIENRNEIYKNRRVELKGIKEREEWLKVIQRNLMDTLDELKEQQIKHIYDN